MWPPSSIRNVPPALHANPQFTPDTIYDSFGAADAGVNTGLDHDLLPKNQLASAVNATVRGGFATNRPPYRKIALDFSGNALLQSRVQSGVFQGAGYYKPDQGPESLVGSIGGRLFQFTPDNKGGAKVTEITILTSTSVTNQFTVPAVGVAVEVQVLNAAGLSATNQILIGSAGYTIEAIVSGTQITVINNSDVPNNLVPVGTAVQYYDVNSSNRNQAWLWQAEKWMIVNDGQSVPIFFDGASSRRSNVNGSPAELPAARMGAYGMGSVWQSGTDGRTFIKGDVVGYTGSGTAANQFRDSVLKYTQMPNLYAGSFIVPGADNITAMVFTTVLNAQQGQGPLSVGTATAIYSCAPPTDITQYQSATAPILTAPQIANGPLGQDSSINVNGDMIYRSYDGIRSLILGFREFQTWGNVPQSKEMNTYLFPDDPSLLSYGSSIYFYNRTLMTFSPAYSAHGVYHRGIIALDGDVISSLRDKKPAVYDGAWTGLNVLKLVTGQFNNMSRAFAFDLTADGIIDLWEILPDQAQDTDNFDNGVTPIQWQITGPQLLKEYRKLKGDKDQCRLMNGEMYVTDLVGQCHFQVFYRPDDYPCWTLWAEWDECAGQQSCVRDPITGCLPLNNFQPQYRPRMGFGEPDPKVCDPTTNRPLREGYSFQVMVNVQGTCKIREVRVMGVVIEHPAFAKLVCNPAPPACDTQILDAPNLVYGP